MENEMQNEKSQENSIQNQQTGQIKDQNIENEQQDQIIQFCDTQNTENNNENELKKKENNEIFISPMSHEMNNDKLIQENDFVLQVEALDVDKESGKQKQKRIINTNINKQKDLQNDEQQQPNQMIITQGIPMRQISSQIQNPQESEGIQTLKSQLHKLQLMCLRFRRQNLFWIYFLSFIVIFNAVLVIVKAVQDNDDDKDNKSHKQQNRKSRDGDKYHDDKDDDEVLYDNIDFMNSLSQFFALIELMAWILGCYSGKKSVETVQFQNLSKSITFIRFSIIPQVIGYGIKMYVYIKESQYVILVIILLLQIYLVYYKIQKLIKAAQLIQKEVDELNSKGITNFGKDLQNLNNLIKSQPQNQQANQQENQNNEENGEVIGIPVQDQQYIEQQP